MSTGQFQPQSIGSENYEQSLCRWSIFRDHKRKAIDGRRSARL
jgi:hypothetical protein